MKVESIKQANTILALIQWIGEGCKRGGKVYVRLWTDEVQVREDLYGRETVYIVGKSCVNDMKAYLLNGDIRGEVEYEDLDEFAQIVAQSVLSYLFVHRLIQHMKSKEEKELYVKILKGLCKNLQRQKLNMMDVFNYVWGYMRFVYNDLTKSDIMSEDKRKRMNDVINCVGVFDACDILIDTRRLVKALERA
jgi:hypothetical protein